MFISVYYNAFILLTVVAMEKIVAEYVCHPRQFKSRMLTCMKKFLKALPFMGFFHLLLMQSGDIETNPGPKTSKNQHGAKSRFMHDLNVDGCLATTDPKELATKYQVSVRTIQRWLRDCLPLRFTTSNPFFKNSLLLNESDESLSTKYNVHIRTIKRWKQDYQHSQFTCSVDLDNDDDGELAKKYGVRTATINLWKRDADMQWSIWHEHCDPSSSCSDGFETLC